MSYIWNLVCNGEPETQRLLDKEKGDGKLPVNEAGIFSYLTISWMTPLVMDIFRHKDKELSEEDVWTCSDRETCSLNTERLETLWNKELESRGQQNASFMRVWLQFFWIPILVMFGVVCFNAALTFVSTGYITDLIVSYLESEESSTPYAIALVLISLISQVSRGISFMVLLFYGSHMGLRFRSGVIGLSYKKLLKLKSIKGKAASEMITIFASDSYRVYLNCQMFVFILAVPVYFLIAIIYVYTLVGLWMFVTIGMFIVCYIIQGWITQVIFRLHHHKLIYTDQRIRKMNEVLSSMKMIKMYAWEDSFTKSIKGIRRNETRTLLKSTILNCISNSIIPITPSLASILTLALYVASGSTLQASTAFSLVATLNFMRVVLAIVPFSARMFGETKNSFQRIKNLLIKEEFEAPSTCVENKSNAIEIRDAVFEWDDTIDGDVRKKKHSTKDANTANADSISTTSVVALKSLNFTVKKGELVGICGSVGCGKSSLLQALIGRMPKLSGHLAVGETVGYVAQQAWIFNGTLRENVLFGIHYQGDWYQTVIKACGLELDIDILPNGDATEIGDRGINISGGQKQRISLARAVYSKSDLYLLDDPLSAVDVHVGQHLFHECIKKVLKNKTIILVTHQLQYLEHCDNIYVMAHGDIVEEGTHDRLLSHDGHYTRLMEQYNGTNHQEPAAVGRSGQEDDQHTESTVTGIKQEVNGTMSTASKKSIDQHEKGILTHRETSDVGGVSFSTFKSYINAAGGICITAAVFTVYGVLSGTVTFNEWWLSIWIDRMNNAINESTNASVSTYVQQQEKTILDPYFIVYVATTAAILFFAILKGFVGAVFLTRASGRLHNRAVERVMQAPMKYFDANPSGRILNRFSRDVEEGDVYIPNFLDSFIMILNAAILSLATTAINLPWFLIALILVILVFYVITHISSVSVRQLKRLENIFRSPLVSHITTSCQGLGTIVAYKQEQNFIYSCNQKGDLTGVAIFLFDSSLRWMGMRVDLAASILSVTVSLILVLSKNTISPAVAALSLSMCVKAVSNVQYLIKVMTEVEARFTSIERLHEYESLAVEPDTSSVKPEEDWPSQGSVIFSDVQMKYRKDMDPVLRNISFEIVPRQKVGIVGRTGAGKSSLAVALFRLTDLAAGHIYIDGLDIGMIPRKLLRSKISTIPQDPVLFAGSLRYNLDPFVMYTDQEIWEALEQAHMKDKMHNNDLTLDSYIEENGENFSVGERQLICLARVILRRNKILVLDEATASIDTSTDAMIQETIRESFSDCTVLTIAHRLNTVLHCDLILVMAAGRVVESGNPQALLADQHSHFSNMLRAQTILSPES